MLCVTVPPLTSKYYYNPTDMLILNRKNLNFGKKKKFLKLSFPIGLYAFLGYFDFLNKFYV